MFVFNKKIIFVLCQFFDDRMVKDINKTWNSITINFCESFCDSYVFERGTLNLSHFATMLGFFQG